MANTLGQLTSHLKVLNKTIFGHISEQKRKLVHYLKKAQHEVEISNSRQAVERELNLRANLERILDQEELLWKQISRCDLLTLGDRNTKFFHSRTLQRRKENHITAFRNSSGVWLYDPSEFQSKTVSFFKHLYEDALEQMGALPPSQFPCLNKEDVESLRLDISNEEIKIALFDMAPLKALESDDFHAIFFQSPWDTIGEAV